MKIPPVRHLGLLALLSLAWFCPAPLFAQSTSGPAPDALSIVSLSEHTLVPSQQGVYSLIDLQGAPSVKIVPSAPNPTTLRFELHGLQYKTPMAKTYQVTALFEDATGAPLGKSQPLTYQPVTGGANAPVWFKGLEGVVGMSGVMPVQVAIPPETHLVTLVVFNPAGGAYPHMVGVVSNIEVVSAP